MKKSQTHKIGSNFFTAHTAFDRCGNLIRSEIREVVITSVYPNYLNKCGLRYGARRVIHADKPGIGMAYNPASLYETSEAAKKQLTEVLTRRIENIQKAIEELAN